MNKAFLTTLCVLGLSLTLLSSAYAEHQEHLYAGHGKQAKHDCFKKLDLNESQKAQIKVIRENFHTANKTEIEALKAKYKQVRDLRKAGKTEEAKALKEQVKADREALKPRFTAMREQIKSVLTPEQQAKMDALQEKYRQKRHKRANEEA